jgi:hypothetical protein
VAEAFQYLLPKDGAISYQASRPCWQRRHVYGFEPAPVFGADVETKNN